MNSRYNAWVYLEIKNQERGQSQNQRQRSNHFPKMDGHSLYLILAYFHPNCLPFAWIQVIWQAGELSVFKLLFIMNET